MLIADSLFQHEVAVLNSSRRLPKMDTPGASLASVSLASTPEFLALEFAENTCHLRMEMLIPSIIQIQFNARL